jgi:hypothetical protein
LARFEQTGLGVEQCHRGVKEVAGSLEPGGAIAAKQEAWRVVQVGRRDEQCLVNGQFGSASGGENPLGGLAKADALHLAKYLRLDVGARERGPLGAHDVEGRVGDIEQDLVLELSAREGGHVLATELMHPRHGLVVEVGRGPSGPLLGQVPESKTLLRSSGGESRRLA